MPKESEDSRAAVIEEYRQLTGHPLTLAEQEARGQLCLINCPPEEDMARQEFKRDTDVNSVVSRYGANFHVMNHRGMFDQNLDLAGAYDAVEQADKAWFGLPLDIRQRFGSLERLMAADADGTLAVFMEERSKPVAASAPAVPEAKP